jgi:hypothetical protein
MTELQASEIIETVLKAHWPNWTFNIVETQQWVRTLSRYDFIRAKAAISEFYMSQIKQGKPAPGSLINALKAKAAVHDDRPRDERTGPLFGIVRDDGRLRWSKFCGNLDIAQQEVEAMALKFTRYANLLEPGHYYELYSRDPEPEGYTGDNGCTVTQRRKQARDVAFMSILDGDDTKTRRWLERYLAKIHPTEKAKGPVPVGDAIEI